MTEKIEESGLGWKMWTGIGASFFYTALAVFFLWHNQQYSDHLKLSEVGDYLAGIFSPLAFLWLVIGYLMQNKELKNSQSQAEKATSLARDQLSFQERVHFGKNIKEHNSIQPRLFIEKDIFNEKETSHNLKIKLKNTTENQTNSVYVYLVEDKYNSNGEFHENISPLNHTESLGKNLPLEVEIFLDKDFKSKLKNNKSYHVCELLISYNDKNYVTTETRTHVYLLSKNSELHVISDYIQTTKNFEDQSTCL